MNQNQKQDLEVGSGRPRFTGGLGGVCILMVLGAWISRCGGRVGNTNIAPCGPKTELSSVTSGASFHIWLPARNYELRDGTIATPSGNSVSMVYFGDKCHTIELDESAAGAPRPGPGTAPVSYITIDGDRWGVLSNWAISRVMQDGIYVLVVSQTGTTATARNVIAGSLG